MSFQASQHKRSNDKLRYFAFGACFAVFVGGAFACVSRWKKSRRKESPKQHSKHGDFSSSRISYFSANDLQSFVQQVFVYYGVNQQDAKLAAEVLITADKRGIDSHGIARLFSKYVDPLSRGKINPNPNIRVLCETPSTATVDGDDGLGLVVGPRAMEIAMKKAASVGSGWVAVRNTNHYGIAGYYSMMALQSDMIGFSMTNTKPVVSPCFGVEAMLGTNPIAVAFPGKNKSPVVIDMATSVVSYGKVEEAKRKRENFEEGWALDRNGNPTTNPYDVSNGGALLPLGGDRAHSAHKGYCLAAMVDILTGVLSGANWGPYVQTAAKKSKEVGKGKGKGHFFGALRINGFRNVDEFKDNIDEWRSVMTKCPAQDGKAVLVPGDPERKHEVVRLAHGIPVKHVVVQEMNKMSQQTGVPMPSPINPRPC